MLLTNHGWRVLSNRHQPLTDVDSWIEPRTASQNENSHFVLRTPHYFTVLSLHWLGKKKNHTLSSLQTQRNIKVILVSRPHLYTD